MNGLIIFLGESFRYGNQGTRNRGSKESYSEQIKACNSHIDFIEHTIKTFQLNSMSVFLASYNTQYDNDLLTIYNKYLVGYKLYDNVIGFNHLFHNSIKSIENINIYDFILYIRIDLYLKEDFFICFNPRINTILFPNIGRKRWIIVNKYPRVNDMMLFIPKKYYKYIKHFSCNHYTWRDLMKNTDLTYDDLDTMINTYHDSDSYKDYNPLYYIVNRPENIVWHSKGNIFNKHNL